MNFLFLPLGSDGDVRPHLSLARALRTRGHSATFGVNQQFRNMVQSEGFEYQEVGSELHWAEVTEALQMANMSEFVARVFRRMVLPVLKRQFELACLYGRKLNTVVIGGSFSYGARIAQEKFGIPLITVHLAPLSLGPGFPPDVNAPVCRVLNRIRNPLDLAPIESAMEWQNSSESVLCLFPKWFGAPQPHWPKNTWVTQFPLPDFNSLMHWPKELASFLKPGERALVFTTGTALENVPAFYTAVLRACGQLHKPGLLLSRNANRFLPNELPANVRSFDFLPLGPVLRRTAAVVHHGGIGTSSFCLKAGVPQLVVPFSGDQFDNARRLKVLGVADVLDRRELDGQHVADKLERLMASAEVRKRCDLVAAHMEDIDPIAEACDAVECYAASRGIN
jgi:rhamnosyltransferase subunit B